MSTACAGPWVVLCDSCMRGIDESGNPVEPDQGWIGNYPQYSDKAEPRVVHVAKPEPAYCPECGSECESRQESILCSECREKEAHGHRK